MARKKQTRKKSANSRAKKVDKGKGKINRPTGVKVVSLLYYIWALLWMAFGLLVALGATIIIKYMIEVIPQLETVDYGTLVVMGIILGLALIALGIIELLVARGLWKMRPWARIVAIVLSLLAVINAVSAILSGFKFFQIVRIIVDGGIVAYLLISKEAREAFK